MDYKLIEEKIFFDTILEVSEGDTTQWLSKEMIFEKLKRKITVNRSNEIFDKFTRTGEKYLDDKDMIIFRISDSGKNYYDFLIKQYEKIMNTETVPIKYDVKTKSAGFIKIIDSKVVKFIGSIILALIIAYLIYYFRLNNDRP
jgi:hypothetical protein